MVSSCLLAMFLNCKMVCKCDIMYRYKYAVGFVTIATQMWNTVLMVSRSLKKVLLKYTACLLHTECTIPSQTLRIACTYCYLFLLETYLPQRTLHDRISPNKKFYIASSLYGLNMNFLLVSPGMWGQAVGYIGINVSDELAVSIFRLAGCSETPTPIHQT